MAFLKNIKLAFGLSHKEDDEIIADDPDTISVVQTRTNNTESAYQPQQPTYTPVVVDMKEEDATTAIFEHVVATFNKSLPDFLQRSVDPEAERKYLYDSLSEDLKKYLKDIATRTEQECKQSWNADKERLQENVRELETKARNIEEKREELSQKQLSVERQKRALSDRVNDLEKQLMTYEAEREQFQLENKSLINKLKVANVNEKDIDAMRDEITRLQEELNKARQAAINPEVGENVAPIEDRSAEVSALEEKVAALEAQLKEEKELNERVNDELELLRGKENDADALTQELSEIEKQIEKFEVIKAKKDERIANLTKELEAANQNSATLKQSLDDIIKSQANAERKLKDEIAQLKSELAEAKQAQAAEPKQAEKRTKSTSASRSSLGQDSPIDDILSDTDWLVSPSSLKSKSSGTNHSNNQHRREENDAQMSLF
jgi:DNA repair exonuclease SbcCD ATPase subunit